MRQRWPALLAAFAAFAACRTGYDYAAANEPRFAGAPGDTAREDRATTDTLRIVSFNIEFSLRIDSAIALLRSEPALRDPDILALQEMDEEGTQRVAEALGMWYVYYPAIRHRRTKRNFGNAVLSRWPIVEDAKVQLPHASRYGRTHRTATAATIRIGATSIRVYSTHLGTLADMGGGAREDQLRAILTDAERHPRVVIAGDMNSADIGRIATRAGYAWPTEKSAHTTMVFRWDHVFLKGLAPPHAAAAGVIRDQRGTSDHRPIWVIAIVPSSRP